MKLLPTLESILQSSVDGIFALIPRKSPPLLALQNCRIISHRGEFDRKQRKENTLAAFDFAVENKVWGIELDIRWTQDLVPVVIHDADCQRVFGSPLRVADHDLASLQNHCPEIPTLEQVIQRYGKKVHLMIEIKQEEFPDIIQQREILKNLLKPLKPADDFHLLALDLALFDVFDIVPSQAMLPVAEFNFKTLSKAAIAQNYAGLCGQYLLMSKRTLKIHAQNQQKVGTGFARSKYCFYRELNRQVDWIFTNHAVKLSKIRKDLLLRKQSHP